MTAPLPSGDSVAGNLPACAFLKSFKLFRTLEDLDWPVLFEAARIVRCEANQLIIREGDKGDELFLIMSGSVQVLLQQAERRLDLAPLSRGAFFGEVGFLTGRPRTATVVAKTPVELVVLSRAGMDSLLKKHPRLRKLIQAVMEGRARATIEAIEKARG
jgi:CRP-like cAMP-binding protein